MAEDDGRHFTRQCIKDLIKLYKDFPCLWNRSDPGYTKKVKRHTAIKQMTELAQQHNPAITTVDVIRRFESLRAAHRKTRRRVEESRLRQMKDPLHAEYVPQLWYYNLLSFLNKEEARTRARARIFAKYLVDDSDEVVSPGPSSSKVCPDDDFDADADVSYNNDDFEVQFDDSANMDALDTSSYSTKPATVGSYRVESTSVPHQPQPGTGTSYGDEYEAIGVNVAAKLRNLPPNMRIMAEKLINDVLFQAQMNSLTPSTNIVVHDPFKTESR